MSRKPHAPTKQSRETVQLHATVGTPQDMIARLLDIDAKTLRKYYRDELDLAEAQANAKIGGALYNKAVGGDTTAQIFWMKTRGRWRETNNTNITGHIQTEEIGAGAAKLGAFIDQIAERSGKAGEPSGE